MPSNCGCGNSCSTACVGGCRSSCGNSCTGQDSVMPLKKRETAIKITTVKKSVIGDTIIERMRVNK